MDFSISIVENSRPAYVAKPVFDGDKIFEIGLEPIVAWQVAFDPKDTDGEVPVQFLLPFM